LKLPKLARNYQNADCNRKKYIDCVICCNFRLTFVVQDERVALLRRGERRSSLFQTTMMQQNSFSAAAAAAAAAASGNPHILISDASSLYSVEELPDELQWPLRRPSTQSVGAVIVAVRQPHNVYINSKQGCRIGF